MGIFAAFTTKWLEFVNNMNEKGIPVPTARDPKTKAGSASFTLLVISGGLCALCILAELGVMFKHFTGDFDLTPETASSVKEAFASSLQFFMACAALYYGRKISRDPKGAIQVEDKQEVQTPVDSKPEN